MFLWQEKPTIALLLTIFVLSLVYMYFDIKKRGPIRRWWSKILCSLKGHNFDSTNYKFLSVMKCKKSSACKRCGLCIEDEIPHDVSDLKIHFEPIGSQNVQCGKFAECKNCEESIFLHGQEHEVSDAQIYFKSSYEDCEKMANCTNCNQPVKLDTQQHVEQRVETACETGMKCKNCNNIRVLEDRHQYKFVSSTQIGNRVFDGLVGEWVCDYDREYKCEVCGKKKIERDRWDERPNHLLGLKEMTGEG